MGLDSHPPPTSSCEPPVAAATDCSSCGIGHPALCTAGEPGVINPSIRKEEEKVVDFVVATKLEKPQVAYCRSVGRQQGHADGLVGLLLLLLL